MIALINKKKKKQIV